MPKEPNAIWLETGYELFALEGPNGLKIEGLARKVGKSKSSFYHHFADLEIFIEKLLSYHHQKAGLIAEQMKNCQSFVPDLLEVLLVAKTDVLFQRQLRIHRNNRVFRQCFEAAHKPIEAALLPFWAEVLGLQEQPHLAKIILNLAVENFYLRVTAESFESEWMLSYLNEIRFLVREMTRHRK